MKKLLVLMLVAAFGVAGFAAYSFSCDHAKTASAADKGACSASKAATASAADCEKYCDGACQAAFAEVTAGKKDCCVAAVKAAMAAEKASMMNVGVVASTRVGSCCEQKASAATASLKECCQESVAAFHAAVAKRIADLHAGMAAGTSCPYSGANVHAVAGSGCSSSSNAAAVAGSGSCSSSKVSAAMVAGGSSCSKSAKTAALVYASIDADEGGELVVTGDAACAHCDFHASDACSALIHTADGKIYRAVDNDRYHELKKMTSEKGFQITAKVTQVDGVKYLEIENVKAL